MQESFCRVKCFHYDVKNGAEYQRKQMQKSGWAPPDWFEEPPDVFGHPHRNALVQHFGQTHFMGWIAISANIRHVVYQHKRIGQEVCEQYKKCGGWRGNNTREINWAALFESLKEALVGPEAGGSGFDPFIYPPPPKPLHNTHRGTYQFIII